MPTFTLAQLRTKAYSRVDNNTAFYGTDEVDQVINECVRVVALVTGFYRTTAQLPAWTVANQLVYTTPAGILIPTDIAFEGRQLQKISLKRLARQRRNWATDTTASKGRVEFWAPVGIGKFVISPKDAQGGRDLTITGLGTPPLLALPNDVLSIENEYVELITEYCAHRLPLKEGGKIFADGSLALNAFYKKLAQRKRLESWKQPKYWLVKPKPEEEA